MVGEAAGPRAVFFFFWLRGHDQMNSAGRSGLCFYREKKVTWEGKEPITKQGPRVPWEGWDGVGGPPSPLSSLGPWGITGTNKTL